MGIADTMGNGELTPFLRIQIVFAVSILGKDKIRFPGFIFFGSLKNGFDARYDERCLFRTQSPVDEIVLHVDDNIGLFHEIGHPFYCMA